MKSLQYYTLFFLLLLSGACMAQQRFTAGNIVVYRIGDGTAAMDGTATRVYLDEFTPAGTLVQSIVMPTSGNKVTMGTTGSAGFLSLSADGKYLVVPGLSADIGTDINSTPPLRSFGMVDFNGMVKNVTVLSAPSFNVSFGACTSNGTSIWFSSGDGVSYTQAGSSVATLIYQTPGPTPMVPIIANGQLYLSQSSGTPEIGTIGTGLPTTTGQTMSVLPGINGPNDDHCRQFAFADLDPLVPGNDVLYIASQASAGGGIQKYSLVTGTWMLNGTIGLTTERYGGLAIQVAGNSVTLFATRKGGNSFSIRGGELVKLTDNSGYNGSFSGTPTVIASVAIANSMSYRGIALVPQPAPFTPGNIVVYRIGDGTTALDGTAARVFLDEFTPSGSLVQSILMPASGNKITMGTSSTTGFLTLSANGKYLVVPGYNVALGGDLNAASPSRSIGLVDYNAAINSVTVLPNPNFDPVNSATSDDGTNLWFTGAGVQYATVGSSMVTSVHQSTGPSSAGIGIVDGQLYMTNTSGTPEIAKVGSGLPVTSGQTLSILPGITNLSDDNARQFAFADLDPNIPGVDVLYLASQASGGGGIQKYSLVGNIWVLNGTIGSSADRYGGLCIKTSTNIVTVFATRRGANGFSIRGGDLVSVTDASGYNGTFAGTPTVLATVTTINSMSYRGIARVPAGCGAVVSLRVPDVSTTQANIFWNPPGSGAAGYEYAITTSFNPPASGTATTNTSVTASGLTNNTQYYVHVRSSCGSTGNSEWSTVRFTTECKPPAIPLVQTEVSNYGTFAAHWNKVFGAVSYEYSISTSATPGSSATGITDTTVTLSNLNAVTQYYFHIRSSCGGGLFSAWTTKPFNTGCFVPAPAVTLLSGNAGLKWRKISNAVNYEYALTYSSAQPFNGSLTRDTIFAITNLHEGGAYYFHIRSVCMGGTVSDWSTTTFNMQGVQVYPNPVKDVLQIQLNGLPAGLAQIVIHDAMGRVVTRMKAISNNTTIDTKGWSAGMYYLLYDDGRNKYSVTILKI